MPLQAFVWGSCVSRDIPRVTGDFGVSHYVGRQSLVSGFNAPIAYDSAFPKDLNSNFKTRSLSNDLNSRGPFLLKRYSSDSDIVLLDLATERRGVYKLGEGHFISNTVELQESGLLEVFGLKESSLIKFGSDGHMSLFESAVTQLTGLLEKLGLKDKTLVVNAPFADQTEEGGKLGPNLGLTAGEWNEIFPAYLDVFSNHGIAVTPPPPKKLILSTEEHLWKRGLDHYIDATYHYWAEQIYDFSSMNGYGKDSSVLDRGRGFIKLLLSERVATVQIRGRCLEGVPSRRFGINAELADHRGRPLEIDRWPVYQGTGGRAKYFPPLQAGSLFQLTSIKATSGNEPRFLTLSLFDKLNQEAVAADLLVVGTDEQGVEVLRRHWRT